MVMNYTPTFFVHGNYHSDTRISKTQHGKILNGRINKQYSCADPENFLSGSEGYINLASGIFLVILLCNLRYLNIQFGTADLSPLLICA